MPPRFHVPDARAAGHIIELPEEEAAHLTRVLRLGPGDRIRVFDGHGREWNATIAEAGKRRVVVRIEESVVPTAEPRTAITLAVALLKGDKMDDIMRDAVMLGAAAIQPLLTERTEMTAAALERSHRVARWQRIAVASAKQCGRAVVPPVREAAPLEVVLQDEFPRVMLVEPAASRAVCRVADVPHLDRAIVLVGPEGGWTPDEVRRADETGAMLLTLGSQTLRADAVPIVALTALRVRWEDF